MTLTQPVTYLPDVLAATFGVPKSAGNIRIVAGATISAVVRVYNNGGGGAFGLSFMGMPRRCRFSSMPMTGGSFGRDDFAMYMLGLLPGPGNRVNVSVVNTNSTTVNGVVEVLD